MVLKGIREAMASGKKLLAVLVDPEKFMNSRAAEFLQTLPAATTHIFVGGSTVEKGMTEETVRALRAETSLPIMLFPGDYSQLTELADGILFISLISGRNPEYLIGQQIKAVQGLKGSALEIVPTGYVLIDGGTETAVQRVTQTLPLSQRSVEEIVATSLAGEYSGKQLIYLEAGSGANYPVSREVISEVKTAISIPLIVGGGIRTEAQLEDAYQAGADMVVMGTVFEDNGIEFTGSQDL